MRCFSPEWLLAAFTALLALITGILARYTFKLYSATVGLGRDAKESGAEQAKKMERSVVQATRAATAMEDVATATKNNAVLMQDVMHKQMRAYISVEIGQAIYQDSELRFEAKPLLTNTGFTPARNVSYEVKADIVDATTTPLKLPDIHDMTINDAGLAPRQSFTIHGLVNDRVPDAEVEAIKKGATRRLFVWGRVTYDDVFGGSWETKFGLSYTFPTGRDGVTRVYGYYYPTHNSST